jgi:hypothetical protein
MANYTVNLHRDSEEAKYDIAWEYLRYPRGSYSVGETLLDERAKKARAALQELVYALRDKRKSEYTGLLRAVAASGYDLYEAFFLGSDDYREEGLRVRTWVAGNLNAKQDTITFWVPARIHIPWGLLYDRPLPDDPGQEIDRDSFWCMKYNVGTHYFNCAADGVEREWRPDEFPLLFGAHETVWTAEYGASEVADEEWRRHLERLLRPPEQPKFRLAELVASWKQRNLPYGLLVFYCHSNEKLLNLGADSISAAEFGAKFLRDRGGDTPPTLVFLAGCQTAIGDLDPGFLKETSGRGFCGFIGTEVKVPNRLTLQFLSDFLAELYGNGGPVFAAMRKLRDKHWPLSLVFSMCCARDLRLEALTTAAPESSAA